MPHMERGAQMLTMAHVPDVLGLAGKLVPESPIALVARIEDGLPLGALDRVAAMVAPGDTQFKYRLVPRATYEHRKSKKLLSAEEGTRLTRLARVWGAARDVWGDEAEARVSCSAPMPCWRTSARSTW